MPFTIPNLANAGFPPQAAPDSGDLDIITAGFVRSGVISGCAVTAATLMNVSVAAGVVDINSFTYQVTANASLAITTADATNPRIDLVYVLAAGTPTVATGTANANPVYPARPANSVILAAIYIPANLTTILSTHVTAKGVSLDADANWVIYAGTPAATASASANVTAWNTAVAALPTAGGSLYVKAGVYYTNSNLAVTRSHVKIVGEPGAIFKLVPGGATTTAANFCMLVLGNYGGIPECTDITVDGIEFDASCVLQDISNAPSAGNNSNLTSILYSYEVGAITNVTNATITVANAGWTVNQWAGLLCSLPYNGGYLVITSNTATVLTLTGVFPTAPSVGDPFNITAGVYTRVATTVTNTTNAVLTVAGATWGVNQFAGMYANVIGNTGWNGPAAGTSMLITSNTSTALTLSGVYATPPTTSNQFQISTQSLPVSSGWEAGFGSSPIVARDCYRLTITNCYVHDSYNTGIEIDLCGSVSIHDNTVDNVGLQFVIGGGNGISCIGTGANAGFPSRGVDISHNRIRRVTDVGIDLHGDGTYNMLCNANIISEQSVAAGGSDARWGISVEIENADTVPNIGTVVSANNIDGQSIGISINNNLNSLQFFAAMGITSNVITNCAVGLAPEGAHLNINGNTMFQVGSGINANGAGAPGFSVERDWQIVGNTIALDPKQNFFGCSGIFLRWGAQAASGTIATITSSPTTNGQSPIVLNMSGGWSGTGQPVVGAAIVVVGCVGDTAANGAWLVQTVTATSVTLANSVSNGTWSSGGTIQMSAHVLDSVLISDNTLLGEGSSNVVSTHCGIYIEALSSGTANSAINHLTIGPNHIHGFNQGVYIASGGANALVSGVEMRGARVWNSNAWGVLLAGTQVFKTVIESCELQGNVSGTISGNTAGTAGNTDVIRNNRNHNPKGLLALPLGSIVATPITTTVYTNNTGYDCSVYITGTVTVVTVSGNITGLTAPSHVRVPVGATLAITGSASLAWKWIAD